MPIISLPEYLGIQEAPQQPVFQRTRQLSQPRSPWERDVQIADAMTQLRQQQPLSQIQAIQNEYDNIMMNAEKIRREREAASQAERAVSALAGLTPESDDYLKQRRQIMTQFPSAVLDPRVQSIMDDSDRMFNARQSSAARMEQERLAAESARADEIQKRATSLIEMGVPPDQAMRDAQSPYTAAQAKFQRSQKPQGSRYEKALGTIQDLIRSVPEDERYDFVDGKQTVRPEFKALLDKQKQYADAYFREIEGEPVTPSATPRTAQIPFRPQEAPTAQATPVAQPAITPAQTQPTADFDAQIAALPFAEQKAFLERKKAVAEFKALLDKQKQYADAYLREIEGEPVTPSATPRTAQIPFRPQEAPTAQATPVAQPAITPAQTQPTADFDAQIAALPFAEQKAFLERKKAVEAEQKAIAPAWTKAKNDIGSMIKKIVPDKPLPGTKVNELESFAKAVLSPNENIIQHPEYGTIPVAWDILNKAGVPMAEIMGNATVFRQPGEGRRLLGFIGTQQVGYQEVLREWAKDFLNSRGKLLPTSQSPTGSSLTEQQQKDLEELNALVRAK
jgi:hypothetical protein